MSSSQSAAASGCISFITNSVSVVSLRFGRRPELLRVLADLVSSGAEVEHLALQGAIDASAFPGEKPAGELLKLIIRVFRAAKGLRSFSLKAMQFYREDAKTVAEFADALRENPLERVSLRYCMLGEHAPQAIFHGLARVPSLRSVTVGGGYFFEVAGFVKALTRLHDLQELNLRKARIGIDGALTLGALWASGKGRAAQLRTLDVSETEIEAEGMAALANGLRACYRQISGRENNKMGQLRSLDLASDDSASEGVQAIADGVIRHNPFLEYLDISRNQVSHPAAVALSEAIRSSCAKSLSTLDVSDCMIRPDAMKLLLSSLPAIESLNISSNRCSEPETAVSNLLRRGKLARLDIGYCNISGAATLGNALSENTSLLSLQCGGNYDLGEVVADLLDRIPAGHPLSDLSIYDCEMGDSGAETLGRLLERTKQLRELHAWRNKIGARGMIALAEAVAKSRSIEVLNVSENACCNEGARSIAENMIRRNRSLRELSIESIQMGTEGAAAIAGAILERSREGATLRLRKVMVHEEGDAKKVLLEAGSAAEPWLEISMR